MMHNLSKVRLSGKCFQEGTTLELFANPKHRFLRVFGRNGAGKSTLSEALASLSASRDGDVLVELLDGDGNLVANQEQLANGVFVFNEKYVAEKIQITADGLGSIVMFDKPKNLDAQIKAEETTIGVLNKVIPGLEKEVRKYGNASEPESPEYHMAKMCEALKSGSGWAERDRRIKGNSVKTRVTDPVLERVLGAEVKKGTGTDLASTIEDAQVDFDGKLKEYRSLKDVENVDIPAVPALPPDLAAYSDDAMKDLLSKTLEKPEFTDRERAILEVLEKRGEAYLADVRKTMGDDDAGYCPHCFRELGADLKREIVAGISAVLSKEADDYMKTLEEAEVTPIAPIDWRLYECIGKDAAKRCEDAEKKCIERVGELNAIIGARKDNVYATPPSTFPQLEEAISNYRNQLEALGRERESRIRKRADIAERKEALDQMNLQIARLEIERDRKAWEKQKAKQESAAAELEKKRRELDEHSEKLKELRTTESGKRIAMDIINAGLAYIFMSPARLVLESDGDLYRLKSNGHNVRPADVSLGERNALGLCHFFVAMMENSDEQSALKNPVFVVIDDPISSFDFENKVGIHSFLKMQFKRILAGNPDSKVLVMTHDAMAMRALGHTEDELSNYLRSVFDPSSVKESDPQELFRSGLRKWDDKAGSYTSGLRWLYDYCCSDEPHRAALRPYAGNMARKTLEAFSTFEYGVGISGIAGNPDAIAVISDESLRNYYENLMFHLVLHGESHSQDLVTSAGLIDIMSQFSDDTIDKMVKGVLCLMNELQPLHVLSHLDVAEAEFFLASWAEEVKLMSGVRPADPGLKAEPQLDSL